MLVCVPYCACIDVALLCVRRIFGRRSSGGCAVLARVCFSSLQATGVKFVSAVCENVFSTCVGFFFVFLCCFSSMLAVSTFVAPLVLSASACHFATLMLTSYAWGRLAKTRR